MNISIGSMNILFDSRFLFFPRIRGSFFIIVPPFLLKQEVLWTDHLSSQFHLFVALAILDKHKDVIMDHLRHFDEILKYVNELSMMIDLPSTLVRAESIFIQFRKKIEKCSHSNEEEERSRVTPELRELLQTDHRMFRKDLDQHA